MPNVAQALKSEIARIARKEIRTQTSQLKTASTSYRHQIAAMRKKIEQLERELRNAKRTGGKLSSRTESTDEGPGTRLRFRAAGFASQRKKLGLSAADMGKLVGVSPLTIYKWEKGQAKPRSKQLVAISQVRGLGKREAAARLADLHGGEGN